MRDEARPNRGGRVGHQCDFVSSMVEVLTKCGDNSLGSSVSDRGYREDGIGYN